MEQNTKHLAEMQNAAGIAAAMIELGGDRPAYARDLVMLCKGAVEQGVQLDAAIAALAEMAVEEQQKIAARQMASQLHHDICKGLEELFRAALEEVIDQRPYFSLERLVQTNQLFDLEMIERFGLAPELCEWDRESGFEITGDVFGSQHDPNPFKDTMGRFSAQFSSDYTYDDSQMWLQSDLDNRLNGVYLDSLRAGAEDIDTLRSIKTWLDRYVTAVRLSKG